MVPLGAGAAVVTSVSAVVRTAQGSRSGAAWLGAAATAGVVAVTVTVNEPMNHRFEAEALTDDETATLLETWARWHRLRVALGVAATVGAALALTDGDRRPRT